jgi:lipid II:glycine glycyltransferase (peptidoglycan interpeptide bridge formation enzyme)
MEVRETDRAEWESQMEGFAPSPFLSPCYLECIRTDTLIPIYLTFRVDGEIIGGTSGIVEHLSNPILRYLGLFKKATFYTGPCVHENYNEYDVSEALIEYLVKEGFTKFIDLGYDISGKPESRIGYKVHLYEVYVIDLDAPWETVKKRMSQSINRKIKKSEKAELAFHLSNDPKQVEDLYRLMKSTASIRESRNLGEYLWDFIPYIDKEVMCKMVDNGCATLGCVKKGDEILSMMFSIHYKAKGTAMFMGTTQIGYDLGANARSILGAMEHFQSNGCKSINLGANPVVGRDGLIQFKTGFGARPAEAWRIVSPVIATGWRKGLYELNRILRSG